MSVVRIPTERQVDRRVPAAFDLFLPCRQDVVSLQTHGRSLFLKAPTMRPVCSAKKGENQTLKPLKRF